MLCGHTARESIEVRPDRGEALTLPGPVHTDPSDISAGPVDVVLLAVKDTQNHAAHLRRYRDVRFGDLKAGVSTDPPTPIA